MSEIMDRVKHELDLASDLLDEGPGAVDGAGMSGVDHLYYAMRAMAAEVEGLGAGIPLEERLQQR